MHSREKNTSRVFSGRLFIVSVFFCAIFSVLFWRLIDVQLVRGQDFWESAERNRWFELPVVPNRGAILDRFGVPMVENKRYYTLVENPDQLYSQARIISSEEALPLLATDSARVRTYARRQYPYGPALAPITGYVSSITQEDLDTDRSIQPFNVLGKGGLESAFERQLRGQLGTERFEVDARVRRQRQFLVTPPQDGLDLQTTADPILSEIAYRALGEQRGVVAISDTNSGHVLSLVSKPTYDPNVFTQINPLHDLETRQTASAQIQSWFADEHQPFFNRAVSAQYPPGSIFKLVTALAGLETEAINLNTTVLDEGVLEVGDFSYANWFWTQHGRTEGEIGLVRSLARSNDIFFYKTAEWIGPNRLAEWSRVLGLGQPVGIEISSEQAGLVPDPAWKQAVVGEPWYLGNTYHYGIGQGDVKTTPLQLLQLTQIFGNSGTMCSPRLISDGSNSCQEVGASEEAISAVLHGMLDACAPGGTSYPFFDRNATALANLSLEAGSELQGSFVPFEADLALQRGAIACKTGTAEFGAQDSRGYRNTHGLWAGILEPRIPTQQVETQAETTETETETDIATESAQVLADSTEDETDLTNTPVSELSNEQLHALWLERIAAAQKSGKSYPKRISIAVIVESDEATPYKEGSRNAAPVAASVIDWIEGKSVTSVPTVPSVPGDSE
jgi:penicillin-binding protein 2